MATELGTAYISIVPETSRIAPGIRNALNGAERGAGDTGRRMGHTMSTALGTALGIGVAKAAGAASRVLQDALSAGYDRITTLEKADIQFRNMGMSAGQTKRQLSDLNDIVTGTSTSLADAAAAAAMLGGAGVTAGDDMNNAVKALVNISAASGASAQDIGIVMMQIKASGKLMGSEALQLAQRGVPVYDLIAKSIGKTTAEVRKMGEEGLIPFETVVKAINDGTGNLAKEMGETLPAKIANFRTSMARLSAAGMEPFLLRAKSGVVGLTDAVNTLTPKMKDFAIAADAKIFDEWIPSIKGAYAALQDSGAIDQARDTFTSLWDALVDLGPEARTIAMSIAEASASLGVGGWQLFLATVQTAAGVLQALTPVLSTVSGLMQAHPGYVTAALAVWLAFKTVPAIMTRLATSIAPVSGGLGTMGRQLSGVRPAITGFGEAYRTSLQYMRQANPQISTAGAHIRVLGANAGMAAQGGMAALSRGAGSVANALGGPLNVGLMAATAGLLVATQAHASAKQGADAQSRAVKDLAQSQLEMGAAFRESRGEMTDDIWSNATRQLEAYSKTLDTTAARHSSGWDVAKNIFDLGDHWSGRTSELNVAAESAMAAQKAMTDLGMTTDEVARAVYGSQGQWITLEQRLIAMGNGGVAAANDLSQLRFEANQQRDAAARVTPGVSELSEAMQVLGDNTSSAAEKSRALKAALDALNPARSKGEAIAQHNEVMRKVAESTAQAVDQTQGFGKALLDQQLGVNTATKNGAALRDSLTEIIDATSAAATSGADMTERNRLNQEAMAALAKQYGVSVDEIRGAADRLGMDDIGVAVTLKGAPEVIQQLASISNAWNDTPEQKTLTVMEDQVNNDTRAALERFGMTVSQPMNGTVTITANDEAARAKFLMITQNVAVLNALKANPNVDLNKLSFDAKNGQVRAELAGLDRAAVSPEAGLVIDKLLQGKSVSMAELQTLSQTTANPKVDMAIEAIMQKIGIVNTGLDQTARERVASIRPIVVGAPAGTPGGPMGPAMPAGANGMIRTYADGGIAALEKYANGGYLTEPQILPGRGAGSLYMTAAGPAIGAEGETGGEAWIPLTPGKRRRSTSLLATVADIFGFDLLPRDGMPNSMSGLLGAVAGGLTTRALRSVAGVRQFADGAVLRRLADGEGASRPLTGAPYVWGGVNWGDCSGAMSAFARSAAGLDPFGGRFTTASMGGQIQQMGGQLGRGGSGDLRFGWYNGGEGGGHTAGTLPDGTNIEMGGGNGGGMVGGSAAGADDPQFTDHAYFKVGPSWTNPGSDQGGWVQRPDGTWAQTGPGGYDVTGGGSSSGSGGGEDKTLSGRLGSAASAFVSGQIQDLFGVLSVNDQPGWMAAITEYENQQRSGAQGGRSVSPEERERAKAEYDAAKDSLKSDYESAKLSRKQDYDQKRQALENEFTLKKIDRGTYERKLNELKHAHEQDELSKKQEYDSRVAEAKSRYDSATGKTPKPGEPGSDPSAALGLKQRYEDEKLARKQQYDAEKAARKERYEADQKALAEEKKNGLGEEQAKVRADRLKAQYDSDIAGMKARYESAELAKKQEFERASAEPNLGGGGVVTDPGTVKPRPGEDLGGAGAPGVPATGNAIKDAFRSGLREAWRQGPPWEATDWIINKESTWNMGARNGKYFGGGQYSPEVWAAAGKQPSADPKVNGEVFDDYVGARYGDPLRAKAHHEANNWYDQGGIAHGIGVMQKNVLKPERVLSPSQTEAFERGMRNGFGGDTAEVVARLDKLIQLMMAQPAGQRHYHLPNERAVSRHEKTERQRMATALAGN
ncbi:tape measure protein [Gordonia phage PhorbesPhlower]|nr:tape measure protein [Gordonia phage PhorbesPhlower]UUG69877.1 tape measure protein [Gordonia phage Morkie]